MTMVAPGGMATDAKRMPTVCTSLPSWMNSRSPLPLSTPPSGACSASSDPAETRTLRVVTVCGTVVEVVLVVVGTVVDGADVVVVLEVVVVVGRVVVVVLVVVDVVVLLVVDVVVLDVVVVLEVVVVLDVVVVVGRVVVVVLVVVDVVVLLVVDVVLVVVDVVVLDVVVLDVVVVVGRVVVVVEVVLVVVEVLVVVVVGTVKSTCRRTAPVDEPSNDSAVRVPLVPVTMMTIGRPLTQPPTFTMSWMIDAMLGVRCAVPAAPIVVHPGIVHGTVWVVRARLEMLLAVSAKVTALLLA